MPTKWLLLLLAFLMVPLACALQLPTPQLACKKKETVAMTKQKSPWCLLQRRLAKHQHNGLVWYTTGWFFSEELQQLLFGHHL